MKFKIRNVVLGLVVINVIVFILQLVLGRNFTESFMLVSSDVFVRPWILLTSMFLHGGPAHLIFNMYVLFLFGSMLERKIGSKRFAVLYLLTGLAASLGYAMFYEYILGVNVAALGASGAVYGVLGAIVILIPSLKVLPLFIPIPMDLWKALVLFAIIDMLLFSNVAVLAHAVGAVAGILFALYLKGQKVKFDEGFYSKSHLNDKDIDDYFKRGNI